MTDQPWEIQIGINEKNSENGHNPSVPSVVIYSQVIHGRLLITLITLGMQMVADLIRVPQGVQWDQTSVFEVSVLIHCGGRRVFQRDDDCINTAVALLTSF